MSDTGVEARENKLISSLKKVFGTVYFVQGTSGFSGLSIFYYMKEVLKLGPVGGQIFQGLQSLAWFVKPLWGYISDKFKLFGYKRKSWFVLMAVIALISWGLIGIFAYYEVHSALLYLILFNFAMTGYAFIDVVADALMCEHGQRLKRVGSFVTFQWKMLAISSLLVALSSGFLQQQIMINRAAGSGLIDYWFVFALTGIFPLLTAYVGIKHAHEDRDLSCKSFFEYFNISPGLLEAKNPLKWLLIVALIFYRAIWGLLKYSISGCARIFGRGLAARKRIFVSLGRAIDFLLTAMVMVIRSPVINLLACLHRDALEPGSQKMVDKFNNFRKEQKIFWLLLLFVFFWNFSPSVGYVSQIYKVDNLQFTPVIFGSLGIVGAITWLFSIIAYSRLTRRFRKLDWAKMLYAMIGLNIVGLACSYYYYLPVDHPWSFPINIDFTWPVTIIFGFLHNLDQIFVFLLPLLFYRLVLKGKKTGFMVSIDLIISGYGLWFIYLSAPPFWPETINHLDGVYCKIAENFMGWNRYHAWSFINDVTLGFSNIPAFLIPLTICGQLVQSRNAAMTYAFLMSVSNITGTFGSLVGGGLYKLFTIKSLSGLMLAFQASTLNISGAAIADEKLLILQIFIYIGALFTFFAIPFVFLLKSETNKKNIKIYLSE